MKEPKKGPLLVSLECLYRERKAFKQTKTEWERRMRTIIINDDDDDDDAWLKWKDGKRGTEVYESVYERGRVIRKVIKQRVSEKAFATYRWQDESVLQRGAREGKGGAKFGDVYRGIDDRISKKATGKKEVCDRCSLKTKRPRLFSRFLVVFLSLFIRGEGDFRGISFAFAFLRSIKGLEFS